MTSPLKIILFSLLLISLPVGAPCAAQTRTADTMGRNGVDLARLRSIQIPASPNAAEFKVSRLLHQKLRDHYGIHLRVVTKAPPVTSNAILVGPALAVASGWVSPDALSKIGWDGYIMGAEKDTVVLAGPQPQGTLYAAYAFLRKIGIKFYPWHLGKELEILEPLDGLVLEPFVTRGSPFFELRDLFPRFERGQYGTSLRRYVLGDLRFANKDPKFKQNGYLGWDHTAGYLVPLHKYYDDHPEYFGWLNGRRIPKSTPNLRVVLCMGNPEVHHIAADRAIGWIGRQPDRRFYMISDGDSPMGCRAPESLAMDPIPDYYTDRALTWVNTVARRDKAVYPDKVILTLAYMGTVNPPVDIHPESNVRVLYAPWYWDSRLSSAVSLNHPLNKTAFEEFSGWVQTAPGQVGVYEYPGNFVLGTAERIKLYARHGVRWIYFNGGDGELLHWVASKLLWDPTLDTEALIEEFTRVFYGPGAPIMNAHLKLRKQTIDRNALHSMVIFDDPRFLVESRKAVQALKTMADDQPPELGIRILEGASDILYTILQATRPAITRLKGKPVPGDTDPFRNDLERYLDVLKQILGLCEPSDACRKQMGLRKRKIYRFLKRLNVMEAATLQKKPWRPNRDLEPIFEAVRDGAEKRLAAFARLQQQFTAPGVGTRRIDLTANDAARSWRFDSSDTSVGLTAEQATAAKGSGGFGPGVRVSAPMTRFPMVFKGHKRIHAGRVTTQGRFDPPLDVGGYRYVDIHLTVSQAVPATIFIDRGLQTRSDVELIAGEQLVRIDFANFIDHRWTLPAWDDRIYNISFDFWPQDNVYPYPPARDVDIRITGIELTHGHPFPDRRPSLRMTHFRTNRSSRKDVLQAVAGPYMQLIHSRKDLSPLGQNYVMANTAEKFRTVTPHRIVSPITRLVTETHDSEAAAAVPRIQVFLSEGWGLSLPHEIAGNGDDGANSVVLQVNDQMDGFRVEASNGRVRVVGRTKEHLFMGFKEYLSRNGISLGSSERNAANGRDSDYMLHEFRVEDHPKGRKTPT